MSLRPRAHIHLDHIVENWQIIRSGLNGGQCAAVLKADAYGHGLSRVGDALHQNGCQHFFVAYGFEGEELRRQIGPHSVIYVLNGPDRNEEHLYRQFALTPVINSSPQFQILVDWLQTNGKLARGYALNFDTGMNRLGLPGDDAGQLSDAVRGREPDLIMSHLACADDATHELNTTQLARLTAIQDAFPGIPVSFANSDGTLLGNAFNLQLARAGIGLFGGGRQAQRAGIRPGLTLEAPILQLRMAAAGETVGYGATRMLAQETLIATVALGYGDGFPRAASNRGFAVIDDIRCPIIGRVSMDLTTIDVTQARHLARTGVFVQFLGDRADLEEQAACAGTIGYELTTGLKSRVERLYL